MENDLKNSVLNSEEPKIYTVSEFSSIIKNVVEDTFDYVRIKGELSGVKSAASGHIYMSLKDETALLSLVCWRGTRLGIKPEDGMEVVVEGKITTYPGRSNYQMVVEKMQVSGVGALLKLLEERKKQFTKEGLFNLEHKKEIPVLPNIIGVVTSPTGSVIRDILHRIEERFPRRVIVWPAAVQGQGAENEIAAGIDGFNAIEDENMRPDVIIVARGGGSLEDLWCFNEEIVVRSVFNSKIPVISAVGHETDTMLIDYVADLRAPTPTGAAEKAVPVKSDLSLAIKENIFRLSALIQRQIEYLKERVNGLRRGLLDPKRYINETVQKLDDNFDRLNYLFKQKILVLKDKLKLKGHIIASYSFKNTLKRGFTIVKSSKNKVLSKLNLAEKEADLEIEFYDGTLSVINKEKLDVTTVENLDKQEKIKKNTSKVAKSKNKKIEKKQKETVKQNNQGSLF